MDYPDLRTGPHFSEGDLPVPAAAAEETLVSDERARLTPSQMVEQKLACLLETPPLPLNSPLRTAGTRTTLDQERQVT